MASYLERRAKRQDTEARRLDGCARPVSELHVAIDRTWQAGHCLDFC